MAVHVFDLVFNSFICTFIQIFIEQSYLHTTVLVLLQHLRRLQPSSAARGHPSSCVLNPSSVHSQDGGGGGGGGGGPQ